METMFGRNKDAHKHLIRNLTASILLYESVTTTETKARVVQPVVERLIRLAQTNDPLTARRKLLAYFGNELLINKIFNELLPRYEKRTSGFTKRFRLRPRLGDGAPMTLIQLTDTILLQEPVKGKESKAKTETPSEEVSDAK